MTVRELREQLFEIENQDATICVYVGGVISGFLDIAKVSTENAAITIDCAKTAEVSA